MGSPTLIKPTTNFVSYSGHSLPVLGQFKVDVHFGKKTHKKLPLLVLDSGWLPIVSWLWCYTMGLETKHCYHAKGVQESVRQLDEVKSQKIRALLTEFSDLFDGSLGRINGIEASLSLKPDAGTVKKFWAARPVPYALEKKVELELQRLEDREIIERVEHDISEYASPIGVVAKRDSDAVRICGDFKVSVNKAIIVEQYPLPKAEDLFAKLGDCKIFTSLDMTEAYHQVPLDEEARKYLVINTKKGLYRYVRLPFGIASAPAIFQRTMETILRGLPGVICYLDDVLIAAKTEEEHLVRLRAVFERLREYGVRLGMNKCSFGTSSVAYLGHVIDGNGLNATSKKLSAVQLAPTPKNAGEVRSFLGLVTYYGKFIPNQVTVAAPLNELLKKDRQFSWGPSQEEAFAELKKLLSSPPVLCHYNPELPLGLATDASQYGVGAVLFHILKDGSERPIAYASKTLNTSQRNYSQIEKEAYSIVFGLTKFKPFLYGRRFKLVTDHKPLLALFGSDKLILDRTSSRLQRWALQLMAYTYDLEFKPTSKHGNADALSRLPVPETSDHGDGEVEDVFLTEEGELVLREFLNKKLVERVKKDQQLQNVIRFVRNDSWPSPVPEEYAPYYKKREELATDNNCLFWGQRLVVPESIRSDILAELHQGHPGMTRMKNLARSYVYWPNMDSDIEEMVSRCAHCQSRRSEAPAAPVHPWEFPEKPWSRLHIDYAGPFHGSMWLVVVDARTKWPEILCTSTATSEKTVEFLQNPIARFGVPQQIVSDNGTPFTGEAFQHFCQRFCIQHIRSSPYHLRSNGEAERLVCTFKGVLGHEKLANQVMRYWLARFLLAYRNTPHATTGFSPAKLLLGCEVRLVLDNLRILPEDRVRKSQQQQAEKSDQKLRTMRPGDPVWVRSYKNDKIKWVAGTVLHRIVDMTYSVDVSSQIWKRHIDHLIKRNPKCLNLEDETNWRQLLALLSITNEEESETQPAPPVVEPEPAPVEEVPTPEAAAPAPQEVVLPRRSTRPRKPVVHYDASAYDRKKKR